MAARYQHLADSIRSDVAKRVGGLIWKPADTGEGPTDPEDSAAGVLTAA
jgi:integrase